MRIGNDIPRVQTLVILCFMIAMIVLAGLGVRAALDTGADAAEILSPLPAPDLARPRPATLESAWPMAVARASEWHTQARLFSLSSQYDWPANATTVQSEPAGGWLVYVFVAGDGDETRALTIMVERNTAVVARETVSGLRVDAAEIEHEAFEHAGVSSIQARDAAAAAGGEAFRRACPATRFTVRQTFQSAAVDENPVWLVTYADARVRNGPALRIVVDAVTGATIVTPFGGAEPSLDNVEPCSR